MTGVNAQQGESTVFTDAQLDEILARAGRLCRCDDAECVAELAQVGDVDVPTLVAEVRNAPTVRTADIQAVVALMDAAGALPIEQFNATPEVAAAINALYEQFEDRIDEHDKRVRFARLVPTFGEGAARGAVYGDDEMGP
jgi:hypothetical protein